MKWAVSLAAAAVLINQSVLAFSHPMAVSSSPSTRLYGSADEEWEARKARLAAERAARDREMQELIHQQKRETEATAASLSHVPHGRRMGLIQPKEDNEEEERPESWQPGGPKIIGSGMFTKSKHGGAFVLPKEQQQKLLDATAQQMPNNKEPQPKQLNAQEMSAQLHAEQAAKEQGIFEQPAVPKGTFVIPTRGGGDAATIAPSPLEQALQQVKTLPPQQIKRRSVQDQLDEWHEKEEAAMEEGHNAAMELAAKLFAEQEAKQQQQQAAAAGNNDS